MCKPFRIASWSDPTLSYQLNDREKFEEIYKPKGFYVVVDEHRKIAERRREERQAKADAASTAATDEPVLLSTDNPTEEGEDQALEDLSKGFHSIIAGGIIENMQKRNNSGLAELLEDWERDEPA